MARGVAGDGAIDQRGRRDVAMDGTAVVGGGVAADGTASQRERAVVVHAAAVATGETPGDRQARERRRHALVDLEHPAGAPRADREASGRADDAHVACQLKLSGRQCDGLRCRENEWVERDLAIRSLFRQADRAGQGERGGVGVDRPGR